MLLKSQDIKEFFDVLFNKKTDKRRNEKNSK